MTSQHADNGSRPPAGHSQGKNQGGMSSYLKLAVSLSLSFVVMYFLTFAMINVLDDLFLNISNLYTGLNARLAC